MKYVITVVLLLCLLVSGCAENSVTAWAWGDSEGIGARVGTKVTANNEVGVSAVLWEEDCEPRVVGIYALRHFPDPVEFRNPLMLDFLPEILQAKAYLGGKLDHNLDLNETSVGPVAGLVLEENIFFEYQFETFEQGQSSVDSRFVAGLHWEF